MENQWDDFAENWDNNPAVREYANKALACLVDNIELNGLRVLDFGAGTGLLSEKMSTMVASIVALDPSTKMIEVLKAKQLPNVEPLALELTPGLMDENPLLQ